MKRLGSSLIAVGARACNPKEHSPRNQTVYKALLDSAWASGIREAHFGASSPHFASFRKKSVAGVRKSKLLFGEFIAMAEESPRTAPTAPAMENQKPNSHGKRPASHQRPQPGQGKKRQYKKMRKRERDMKNGSTEEVLAFDIRHLRASLSEIGADELGDTTATAIAIATAKAEGEDVVKDESLPAPGSEIILKVIDLSSTGDALAVQDGSASQIYVLPFAVPGDIVKAKVHRHLRDEGYTVADFVSVVTPGPMRDDSRVQCGYFSKCSGCQFQMLSYADQLSHKKGIVERAFANFSELPPDLIPVIGDTIGSPLQYGYRTKLTPHFDGPPGPRRNKTATFTSRPDIGFMLKGRRVTLDIEDCPIGTDAVRLGMKSERERLDREYAKYKKGATILLRESTKRVPKDSVSSSAETEVDESSVIKVETDTHVDWKSCVTDNNGTSTEYIGDYVFHNPAGSFFQNNNSILPVFTDYIRQHILPPSPSSPTTTTTPNPSLSTPTSSSPIKYLIDAYSGSGLFTITLSSLFKGSTGIDIAESSIAFARTNASANNLPPSQANFIAADAGELFKSVRYPADETVVVLDPPRKGCDADFLNQLLRFAPRRVVYVSCNVHTQARDVGVLVRGEQDGLVGHEQEQEQGQEQEGENENKGKKGTRYTIESLRGFDFFPQTGHVEGVAVLNRID
ncbi:S-adenosyl-L-methionine-dependent methyltransferase [Xylaria arbuscula]|nr:S-adenosyl-L-methionine-dependent methyltransferase [Xylaria arbuscula]